MAKGVSDSYTDGLVKVIEEIARAKTYGDSDLEFLDAVEKQVLDRLRSPGGQQAPVGPGGPPVGPGAPDGLPGTGDPLQALVAGGGLPQMDRGPTPSIPTADMSQAIERSLAGQVGQ